MHDAPPLRILSGPLSEPANGAQFNRSEAGLIRSENIRLEEKVISRAVDLTHALQPAEKIVLVFLGYTLLTSLVFPLSLRERLVVVGANFVAGSAILLLAKTSCRGLSPLLATIRDWLPAALILLAYRESGLFVTPDPTHHLDYLFIRWDSVLLKSAWVDELLSIGSPWLQYYLEFCYFLCYALVPLGIGSCYLARRLGVLNRLEAERAINHFWTTVLLAVLCCYLIFPLFPLTPPRVLFHDLPGPPVRSLLRHLNLWLLGNYSVEACIFPSGHVAAVTSIALSLRAHLPRVSMVFLVGAVSVAAATVYGRYHYSADAVAGAFVGLAAYYLSNHIHKS